MSLSLDEHLFGPGPKRILSLDGGGVLGVVEIAFLEKLEDVLRAQHGGDPDFRLSDYFDLIGGTSTGAIIATTLAMGKSVAELKRLYFDMAPALFSKPRSIFRFWQPRFDAAVLADKLHDELGDEPLGSAELLTGLAIVAKRLDTASPWVLLNSKRWKYWDDSKDRDHATGAPVHIGNRHYMLRDVVRASTAAPFFFAPHEIVIASEGVGGASRGAKTGETGIFVDGAMSPHNNPALALLMLARLDAYGLDWRLGERDLLMISIGTGFRRPRVVDAAAVGRSWFGRALEAYYSLRGMSWDGQMLTLKILQWISEPRLAWRIDAEVDTMRGELLGDGIGESRRLLSFQRYDLPMQAAMLKEMHGIERADSQLAKLNDIVNPKVMQPAFELAREVSDKQVLAQDFPAWFRADRFTVGFTGHRPNRLAPGEIERIAGQITQVLADIARTRGARAFALATGLAEGADRMAAAAALELGWSLDALLPFSQCRYLQDFGNAESRAQFLAFAARATRMEENEAGDHHADAELAYAEQGKRLVERSHALVTVWDGQSTHGTGGTAEAIAMARDKGIPVYWIKAGENVEPELIS